MLGRGVYAAILALLLVSVASADSLVENQKSSNVCIGQESTKDITQGGEHENNPFNEEDRDKNTNIVRQITGKMSDSRKMGIGALLVLISSVLYAGFNWNEEAAF
jgi:hypothetical protein